MQWHWGNIGSAAAGLAVLVSALFTIGYALISKQGPALIRAIRDRTQAQTDQARAATALDDEQRKDIELNRRRALNGWSPGGVEVYRVALVTEPAEMDIAREQLAPGHAPSQYVIVRVAESPDTFGNAGRAHTLRQMIIRTGLLARAPEAGEYEALLAGREVLTRSQSQEPSIPRDSTGLRYSGPGSEPPPTASDERRGVQNE